MPTPSVEPILDSDLEEYCELLRGQFKAQRSVADWMAAFQHPWCPDKPNNGFMLRDDGRIVGGIGAIYAKRVIRGNPERFCNVTSWWVLDAYRSQSMRLAIALTSQPGYHFTDLTPTGVVLGVLKFLKFKPLDAQPLVVPNLPSLAAPFSNIRFVSDPNEIETVLTGNALRTFRDHLGLSWLQQMVIGRPGGYCHVISRRIPLRGLTCTMILGFSDRELFRRYFGTLRHHLLIATGAVFTRIERRLLGGEPLLSRRSVRYPRKLYRSDTLAEGDIDNIYSELTALRIRSELL